MNVIKEIERINKAELEQGSVNTPASWHAKYAQSAWVYVGNLPLQLSEGDILAVMSQWGEIEDINLVRDDKDTGKSRGFCFLKYEDSRSCILSVDNFNGTKILGRSIRVDHVENYRLPKHLREKEEGGEDSSSLKKGHAYVNKELENSFDIHQGQDLFAVPPSTVADAELEKDRNSTIKTDSKEAKRERKRLRDKLRKEKAARKEEREERRRKKRAKRLEYEEKRSRN